jgi:hypothetical protein
MTVPVAGGHRRFRPLAPSAIQTMPPPYPKTDFVELPASASEQFFLYAVVKVDSRQGLSVEQASSGGARWAGLWIDGRALSGNAILALEPGLHRVLVCVRSTFCSPTFPGASPEWGMAKHRRYELLKQRWEDARKRHAETGEVEDVAVIFDLLRQSIRSALWYETGVALSDKRRRGVISHNSQFALACRAATGQGPDPDMPRSMQLPGESFGDVGGSLDTVATDRDLIFMLGLAPEAILPNLVREYDKRLTPEKLARFGALEQIVAFVNYPLDLGK